MSKSKEIVLGAVYCGSQIAPGLFAEEVGSGRFLIRVAEGTDHAKRVGEVFGGAPHAGRANYQAMTMKGDQVASKSSLKAAALELAAAAQAARSNKAVPFITARGQA
jgi:hypothetical protein